MHYLLIDQKALLFEQKIFVLEALCCLLVLSQLTTQVCELAHFAFFLLVCRCSCILVQVLLHTLHAAS